MWRKVDLQRVPGLRGQEVVAEREAVIEVNLALVKSSVQMLIGKLVSSQIAKVLTSTTI